MKVLLDTHAMYWYIEGDSHLSASARSHIQDASNEVFISPASFWEIAIKISLGKWQLNRSYEEFIDIGLSRYAFQIIPILPSHAGLLIGLPFHHKDPFDRLIVAQAKIEGMTIISNDTVLDAYGGARIW